MTAGHAEWERLEKGLSGTVLLGATRRDGLPLSPPLLVSGPMSLSHGVCFIVFLFFPLLT